MNYAVLTQKGLCPAATEGERMTARGSQRQRPRHIEIDKKTETQKDRATEGQSWRQTKTNTAAPPPFGAETWFRLCTQPRICVPSPPALQRAGLFILLIVVCLLHCFSQSATIYLDLDPSTLEGVVNRHPLQSIPCSV